MYYSLVGRALEYEFQSFAGYYNIGILVWSALAGGFLSGKYSRNNPAPAGTRFAEAGRFVPFDKENGYKIVDALKEVAKRHDASPARVAVAWVPGAPGRQQCDSRCPQTGALRRQHPRGGPSALN